MLYYRIIDYRLSHYRYYIIFVRCVPAQQAPPTPCSLPPPYPVVHVEVTAYTENPLPSRPQNYRTLYLRYSPTFSHSWLCTWTSFFVISTAICTKHTKPAQWNLPTPEYIPRDRPVEGKITNRLHGKPRTFCCKCNSLHLQAIVLSKPQVTPLIWRNSNRERIFRCSDAWRLMLTFEEPGWLCLNPFLVRPSPSNHDLGEIDYSATASFRVFWFPRSKRAAGRHNFLLFSSSL